MPDAITGEQACRAIVDYWISLGRFTEETLRTKTKEELARAVWNSSPTGELSQVFIWYWEAQAAGFGVSS
jgi:hypothetical protein